MPSCRPQVAFSSFIIRNHAEEHPLILEINGDFAMSHADSFQSQDSTNSEAAVKLKILHIKNVNIKESRH